MEGLNKKIREEEKKMFRLINNLKNKKGFTLIELIVVLAVLAIIMAIAVPRFLGVQKGAELDADYSTGALIAKAAELYNAKTGSEAGNAKVLIDAGYIDDFSLQSDEFSGVDTDDITITYGAGSVTVTAGAEGDLYPRP